MRGYKRLERLITLGEMVLDARFAAAHRAPAAAARDELAWPGAGAPVVVLIIVVRICAGRRGKARCLRPQIDKTVAFAELVRIEEARGQIIVSGHALGRVGGRFEQQIERLEGERDPRRGDELLARLGEQVIGPSDILGVGARIRCPAVAAGVVSEHRSLAAAAVARLRIEFTDRPTPFAFGQFGAARVHAGPETRQTAMEGMDPARQETGIVRLQAGAAAHREQRVDRAIAARAVRRVEDQIANLVERAGAPHRLIHEQRERRIIGERVEEVGRVIGRGGDAARCQERHDCRGALGRVFREEAVEVHSREQREIRHAALRGAFAQFEISGDGNERLGIDPSQLRRHCAPNSPADAFPASEKLAVAQMTWKRSGGIPSRSRSRRSNRPTSAPWAPR